MGKKFDKTVKNNAVTSIMVIVAWLVMMALQQAGMLNSSTTGLLVPVCIYSIMAVSLNLTVGILGDLSLGQAGFMCVGAFASAFFTNLVQDSITFTPLRFTLAILIGALVAGVFGLLIGIPVLRLSGDYLAIVTLAFGEIIKNFLNILYVGKDSHGLHVSIKDTMSLGMEPDGVVIIKGAQGITGTSRDATFTIGIILLLISLFIVLRLVQSRDGRAIRSIRDNRIAAESIGINITKYKLLALTVSAAIAGSDECQVWLQYVHHDSGIRRTRRYRKYPRISHCSNFAVCASREAAFPAVLPYADLCSCTDCGYAL